MAFLTFYLMISAQVWWVVSSAAAGAMLGKTETESMFGKVLVDLYLEVSQN